jgi:glycosyltransferase involved in cell wall biosynthesis
LTKFKILSIRRKFHIPVKAKLIGFLGTVTFDKGIRDFISLSKYLLRNNPNYYFVIVGDGPALTWCKCQVSEHEFFRKYIFVGYQSDVRQYLGIFDYFYFPTRHHEGLSMALLESFSMGRIVITRDIGGNREVVRNGYNGFIYRNLSKHIVFKTISQVNRNLKLRARIMRNARNTIIRDFNIKNQARNLRKILLDI